MKNPSDIIGRWFDEKSKKYIAISPGDNADSVMIYEEEDKSETEAFIVISPGVLEIIWKTKRYFLTLTNDEILLFQSQEQEYAFVKHSD